MFGVSGVLNLSHGGIMVVAALVGWLAAGELGLGTYMGTLVGVAAGLLAAYLTYFVVVRPIQRSRAIPREETEIFVLTGTLLWGIMIQVGMAYVFTNNPVTMRPLISGVVQLAGVRTPRNEIMIAALCWIAIGLLWLLVNRTRAGKALLAASINPRGLTLLGFELSNIYLLVWTIYGVLAGIAGVLLASFLGISSDNAGQLTASAFSIVVLGGLGSVSGSLVAAYVVGYLETITAYLVAPTLRPIPALLLLVLVVYLRPQGLLGRR
jgi:branched-chain amino acid transport system permease protein